MREQLAGNRDSASHFTVGTVTAIPRGSKRPLSYVLRPGELLSPLRAQSCRWPVVHSARRASLAQADLARLPGLSTACNPPVTLDGCVPFSDMDANFSNGSSVYHGLSANLRKRYGNHYEFLASYTWSHAIDDSIDLQATLAPQDSYYPGHESVQLRLRSASPFCFQRRLPDWQTGGRGICAASFSATGHSRRLSSYRREGLLTS